MDAAVAFNSHPIPEDVIEGAEWEDISDLFGAEGGALPMAPVGLAQLESLRVEMAAATPSPAPAAAAAAGQANPAAAPGKAAGSNRVQQGGAGGDAGTEAVWVAGAQGLQLDFLLPSLRPPEFDSLDAFLARTLPPLVGTGATPPPTAAAGGPAEPCASNLTGQVAQSDYNRVLDNDVGEGISSAASGDQAASCPAVLQHPRSAAAAAAAAAAPGPSQYPHVPAGGPMGMGVGAPVAPVVTTQTGSHPQRVSPFATAPGAAAAGGVAPRSGFSISDLAGAGGSWGRGEAAAGAYPAVPAGGGDPMDYAAGGSAGISLSAIAAATATAAAAAPTNSGGGGGGAKETCRACGYRGAFGNRTRLCNDCIEHRGLMDAPRHDKQRGAVVKLPLGERLPGFYFARQRRMVPHTADTLVEEVLAKMEGLDWGAIDPAALLEVVAGRLLGFRTMLASKGRTPWEAATVTPEHRAQLWELLRDAYRRYHSKQIGAEVPPVMTAATPLSLLGLGDPVQQQQQASAGLPVTPQGATMPPAGQGDAPASKRAKLVTTDSALVPGGESPCLTTVGLRGGSPAPLLHAGSGTGDVQVLPDQQQQSPFTGPGWGSGSGSRGLPATSGCVSSEAPALLGTTRSGQQQQDGMPPELAAALQQYSAAAAEAARHRKRVRAMLEEHPQLQMAVAQVDAKVWGVDAGAVPGLVGPAAGALGLAAQGGEVYMEPGCVRVTMHLLMSHKNAHQLAAKGMASLLDTLLVTTPPTSPWRQTSWTLQLGDTLAVVKAGRPCALLDVSPEAAEGARLPLVHRVGPLAAAVAAAGDQGVEFMVEGCHLDHPGVRFSVKSENRKLWEGRGLPVAAAATAGEECGDDVEGRLVDQTVKFRVTPPRDLVLPALVWVEVTQGLYAAPAVPVLLVQDAQVAQELSQLEELGLAPAYTGGLTVNAALVLQAAAGHPLTSMGAKASKADLSAKAAGLAAVAGVMGWTAVAAAVAPLLPAPTAGSKVGGVAKALPPGLPVADSRLSAVSVPPDDASTSSGSSDGGDAAGEVSEEEGVWGGEVADEVSKQLPNRKARSLTYQDSAVDRHTVDAFRSKLTMLDQPLSSVSEREAEAAQPLMPGARSSGSCNF